MLLFFFFLLFIMKGNLFCRRINLQGRHWCRNFSSGNLDTLNSSRIKMAPFGVQVPAKILNLWQKTNKTTNRMKEFIRGKNNSVQPGIVVWCPSFVGSVLSLRIKGACFTKFFSSSFNARVLYNMRTVYFQHTEGEEKVYINVNFNGFNINKVFNFERNILEKVGVFIEKFDARLLWLLEKKKLPQSELSEALQCKNSVLLLNDELLSNDVVFQEFFKSDFNGNLKLRILGSDYDVHLNCPVVKNMTLPKKLTPETLAHPETFETKFTDESKSEFIWFRSPNHTKINSWEQCGKGYFYKVSQEDINHYLKLVCIPKCMGKVGPTFEVVSNTAVESFENFEEIQKRHEFTRESTKPDEFRIVSYNILSDIYINTKDGKTVLFVFCDSAYLDLDYRKTLLNFELIGYNADIICLQEVDRNFYKFNLLVLFTEKGYSCFYHEKEGTREGCAFMFNRNKFDLLSTSQCTFTKELLNNPLLNDIKVKIESNEKLMQRLQCLSSQIQVFVLESMNKEVLVIGNTHLYSNPDADHIRLLQGVISWRILLDTAEKVKAKEPNKRVSIVLCGDLNSTPECGFHQLLNTGHLDSNHIGWKSKADEEINDVSCTHSVNMKSAYSTIHFTNYTPLFKGCLDYIYFQSDNLELKQTVPIPSEDILGMYSGIPSKFFPSDHVALVADLKFKNVH